MKKTCAALLLALTLAVSLCAPALAATPSLVTSGGSYSDILATDDGLLLVDAFHKVIWKYTKQGVLSPYAGQSGETDLYGEPLGGYRDDTKELARFGAPCAIVPYLSGYAVSDSANNAVRLITDKGVQTVVGGGNTSVLNNPTGLAADKDGSLYIADTGSGSIVKVTAAGTRSTFFSGLNEPTGLCWHDGTLYVADSGNHRICSISGDKLTVVAGGAEGYADGTAANARFSNPQGVAVLKNGDVYVADSGNGAVRRVSGGWVTTLVSPAAEDDTWPVSPRGLCPVGDTLYVGDVFSDLLFSVSLKSAEFADVAPDAPYADAVRFVTDSGYLLGTSETSFSPDELISRAQFTTVLCRVCQMADHSILPVGSTVFSDVPERQYYTQPVAWAADNGIVKGVGNGAFEPNAPVTREMLAQMLYNCRSLVGLSAPPESGGALSFFADAGAVSAYAVDAMGWAVAKGVLSNSADSLLRPADAVTRAEAAQILCRLLRP